MKAFAAFSLFSGTRKKMFEVLRKKITLTFFQLSKARTSNKGDSTALIIYLAKSCFDRIKLFFAYTLNSTHQQFIRFNVCQRKKPHLFSRLWMIFMATIEEEIRRQVRRDWREKLSEGESFSELVIREMKQIEINN